MHELNDFVQQYANRRDSHSVLEIDLEFSKSVFGVQRIEYYANRQNWAHFVQRVAITRCTQVHKCRPIGQLDVQFFSYVIGEVVHTFRCASHAHKLQK